jgi:2-polyprenyl-3-methyl-5-hydroxy-6-metoxy-1,4-benzoquinol methylase
MSEFTNEDHQAFEKEWWGNCCWTFGEENKQITYANRMGLEIMPNDHEQWPLYNLEGKSVLDIGGGPVSMLLKTVNGRNLEIVDPCSYPNWVMVRYQENNILYRKMSAEEYYLNGDEYFDEVWIYNVLQHVESPLEVMEAAKDSGKLIRIFEWINTAPCLGHPHTITAEWLDSVFGKRGIVEQMNGENGLYGTAYYGVFTVNK